MTAALQNILMLEGFTGGLIFLGLCILFFRAYRINPDLTYAYFLAVIFAGVTFKYAMNVVSLIINQGEPCFGTLYYTLRILGSGIMCVLGIYGGVGLLILSTKPASASGEEI